MQTYDRTERFSEIINSDRMARLHTQNDVRAGVVAEHHRLVWRAVPEVLQRCVEVINYPRPCHEAVPRRVEGHLPSASAGEQRGKSLRFVCPVAASTCHQAQSHRQSLERSQITAAPRCSADVPPMRGRCGNAHPAFGVEQRRGLGGAQVEDVSRKHPAQRQLHALGVVPNAVQIPAPCSAT